MQTKIQHNVCLTWSKYLLNQFKEIASFSGTSGHQWNESINSFAECGSCLELVVPSVQKVVQVTIVSSFVQFNFVSTFYWYHLKKWWCSFLTTRKQPTKTL